MTDENMDEGLRVLVEQSEMLTTVVSEMAERVNTTQEMQEQLARQQRQLKNQQDRQSTQGKINFWLGFSIVFDIVLTAAISLGYVQINETANRADHNTDLIQTIQSRVSKDVLCPQYTLWLGLVKSSQSRPGQTAEQKKQAKDFKRVFEQGYVSLGCWPPLPS